MGAGGLRGYGSCLVRQIYLWTLSMPLIAKIYSLKDKDLTDSWFELSSSSKTLRAPGARHDLCYIVLRCVVINANWFWNVH